MIDLTFLNRAIVHAESHEATWPSIAIGPIVLASVTSATLAEAACGIRPIPDSVEWTALSCAPLEVASWQAVDRGTTSQTLVQLTPQVARLIAALSTESM